MFAMASPHFRVSPRLCENYFLTTETKYLFMKLASVAIMIRIRYHPDSNISRKDLASAFSHSLDPQRSFIVSSVQQVSGLQFSTMLASVSQVAQF